MGLLTLLHLVQVPTALESAASNLRYMEMEPRRRFANPVGAQSPLL